MSNPRTPCYPGDTYGYLTVLATHVTPKGTGSSTIQMARCLCACGKVKNIAVTAMVRGNTKSCGCRMGRSYELASFQEIAKEIGCSDHEARAAYRSGLKKLARGLKGTAANYDQLVAALVSVGFFDESEVAA